MTADRLPYRRIAERPGLGLLEFRALSDRHCLGIGGEYAAVNSAIDELIPAKYRGRIDLVVNGSFWLGAAAGALAAPVPESASG